MHAYERCCVVCQQCRARLGRTRGCFCVGPPFVLTAPAVLPRAWTAATHGARRVPRRTRAHDARQAVLVQRAHGRQLVQTLGRAGVSGRSARLPACLFLLLRLVKHVRVAVRVSTFLERGTRARNKQLQRGNASLQRCPRPPLLVEIANHCSVRCRRSCRRVVDVRLQNPARLAGKRGNENDNEKNENGLRTDVQIFYFLQSFAKKKKRSVLVVFWCVDLMRIIIFQVEAGGLESACSASTMGDALPSLSMMLTLAGAAGVATWWLLPSPGALDTE